MLIITQYQKIGNIFSACNDIAFTGDVSNQCLDVKHRFGKTSDEIECGIRYLLTNLRLDKNVVICLSLKENSRAVMNEILKVLQNIK